ncbi:MAG: aconitase X [Candidatus Limnocylindrales bacterium]
MRQIAVAVDGRTLKKDLWVCVSRAVFAAAQEAGYTKTIEASGATIVRDTCPVLGPTLYDKGYKTVATNSGKLAHYMPGLWGVQTSLLQFEDCIAIALQ